ncbi:MAG: hypothetical protein A2297_03415 [Elusimicrobia bacterium RIFOXYB2_FULL_48_7]|nr:MAG: hypothetical protein A2297_03415 [Elusimicrobia bacterium RIFOXYB2_FULL_48_7]
MGNEKTPRPPTLDDLKAVIKSLNAKNVDYLLIGGFAVNAQGLNRTTNDIDFLIKQNKEDGKRIVDALLVLPDKASKDIDLSWFDKGASDDSTIRVYDEIIVDLLFNACGQSYESLKKHEKIIYLDDVPVKTLDIEGLMLTKISYREQDKLDLQALKFKLEEDIKNKRTNK